MSNKAIKIPIYAPTVVLSVFAEREGNSVTAPFFSALYSDGDIEFDIWQALVYNAEAATVTSREMKAAEAALLYNHAQLGFVSTFYRHTKQYTRAKESDLDVAMIDRIITTTYTAEDRIKFDEWLNERMTEYKTITHKVTVVNYTKQQYVVLEKTTESPDVCSPLFYLCAVGNQSASEAFPLLGSWAFNNIAIVPGAREADGMQELLFSEVR